ncbi:electron transport complex subunit RsxC [Gilvimarinus agarilyticus]|uniref:electron transport complex subunit RsxC n=1 Tax=Gilvimarinus sp. 2_MG-2023 TaxID=3062666 RepID=UPI001C08143E|nr:electron transport complex subunit RsxC [Gilvimarinus sp. 2_MG-2023]MBU2886883.1 electron transport complex subunit RsxC [Gilvimarinus agarilyticus]MDO6571544.1 electron transport complex subunit RsxC [Gilvimarinus sp. 2_MG-2023]
MELIKVWDIPGGVHPPENKTQSLLEPLGPLAIAPQLILPVSQHIGAPAKPIVEVGDQVLGGQVIAEADGVFSANVHAPTSGRIAAIVEHTVPHPSGMTDLCIILDTDGKDDWTPLSPWEDYAERNKDDLLARIRESGIAGLGGAGFPAAVKLNPRANHPIDTLIINGTECEPYITADDVLMRERAQEVIAGTQILAQLLNQPERVVIGVEDNKPEAIAALRKAAEGSAIQVVSFPTKYPSGGEKQLIQILTGREVPAGQIPAAIGVVCQNVGTTAAIYRAVRFGEPLVKRITTVVGEALQTQRNIEVLFGTPVNFVLEQHGYQHKKASRLVMGGPMMGFSLPDLSVPVVKTTNCLLAPSKKELPPPEPAMACIRCGMCAEACPVELLPQQLFWYAQAEDLEKLETHNLFDCIECGACSYVCPSHIPLVQYYRAAKGEIRQHRIDKEKSDRSRRRFEFRQDRIAKEEAEKEAKRLARKKAAEEAKKKLAEQKANTPAEPKPAAVSTQDTDKQRAKLERLLASAHERLKKAEQPLAEEATDEQAEKQAASIKQAQLKVSDAQKKLDAFIASQGENNRQASSTEANDPVAAAIERAKAKQTMSPEEKLRNSVESLQKRLQKAEQKVIEAKDNKPDMVEALQQGVDKLKDKLSAAQNELAELTPAAAAPATPANATPDVAQAAIERAKAKLAMSPEEKLRSSLESLYKRLEKAEQKAAGAKQEDSDKAEALQQGVERLKEKIASTQKELAEATLSTVAEETPQDPATSDAASLAIEKAKAKAAAMATMSASDKLRNQVDSLQARLEKAQARLEKAEQENDDNIDAFRTGVSKLEEKLATARDQLAELT